MFISDPDRIRIRPKVSDPSGSGYATLILAALICSAAGAPNDTVKVLT